MTYTARQESKDGTAEQASSGTPKDAASVQIAKEQEASWQFSVFRFQRIRAGKIPSAEDLKRTASAENFWWLFPALAIFLLWMKVRANNNFPFVSTSWRAGWVPRSRCFSDLTFGASVRAVETQSIERTIEDLLA